MMWHVKGKPAFIKHVNTVIPSVRSFEPVKVEAVFHPDLPFTYAPDF